MPRSFWSRFTFYSACVFGLLAISCSAPSRYAVYDGDVLIEVEGEYETVGDVLVAGEVMLRVEDVVVPRMMETAVTSIAIQITRATPVILRTDEGTKTLWTQQPTLGAFLREAGVAIERTTDVFVQGVKVGFNQIDEMALPSEVEIGRFHTVIIVDGTERQTVRTAVQTVGELLVEAGITVFAADGVEPPLGSWLESGMEIAVQRSMPLTIHVDGTVLQTRSHYTNPLAVLAEAGIGLVGLDYIVPDNTAVLRPNDSIQVVRVTEDFQLEDEPIPFTTIWQASDQMDIDTRGLLTAGVPGILRRRIRVQYENGVAISQEQDGEWAAAQPVNEVMGYGTRINIGVVQTPTGSVEYWRIVRMRVTSYTAASSGKEPDDLGYGITASGRVAGYGIVAVDRRVVPFRSDVYVPGYGVAFVGDTGGGVRGRWIDLGYGEEDFVPWSGYVDVYYLTPVPPAEDINYLLPTVLP